MWIVDYSNWKMYSVCSLSRLKRCRARQQPMGEEVRNVIIIGSGPAGYTAGLYTARALLNPLMFAGYMSVGQLMLTSDVENFP